MVGEVAAATVVVVVAAVVVVVGSSSDFGSIDRKIVKKMDRVYEVFSD
jgi:hypothetical protein